MTLNSHKYNFMIKLNGVNCKNINKIDNFTYKSKLKLVKFLFLHI